MQWILDGYTTSANYPYSQTTTLDTATEDAVTSTRTSVRAVQAGQVNYVRNSVKATVDAYDGTVTLYQWDEADPVLKAWMSIFPGTVKPLGRHQGLAHGAPALPRGPLQGPAHAPAKYHDTDAASFYGGQNFWRVPEDPTQQGVDLPQPPYYLSLAMPDQSSPAFSLTSTFMPTGDRNVLSGFLAVDGDAGNQDGKKSPNYGKMRLLETTGGSVNGPGLVYNDMRTSSVTSNDASLGRQRHWRSSSRRPSSTGASVIFGNQLTLPVGGGLLYVQPIYVQARSTARAPTRASRPSPSPSATRSPGPGRSTQRSTTSSAVRRVRRPVTTAPTPTPTPHAGHTATPTPTPSSTASPSTPGSPDAAALSKALKDARGGLRRGRGRPEARRLRRLRRRHRRSSRRP